jgi:hypothetical protein
MQGIVPTTERLAELDTVKAAHLDGGSFRLFQNDIVPNKDTVAGDLLVCNFTGYSNVAIATWSDAFIDDLGRVASLGTLAVFHQTGSAVTNTAYGAYYLNAAGDLVWAIRFDQPFQFSGAGLSLPVVPKYFYGGLAA